MVAPLLFSPQPILDILRSLSGVKKNLIPMGPPIISVWSQNAMELSGKTSGLSFPFCIKTPPKSISDSVISSNIVSRSCSLT